MSELKLFKDIYTYKISKMAEQKFNVCYYYTAWSMYGRNHHVKDLEIDSIPEIAYAFFNLKKNNAGYYIPVMGDPYADIEKRYTSGGVEPQDTWYPEPPPGAYHGNFGQLKKLKDQGKKFHLAMSIGGWSWSKHFSTAMKNEVARKYFIDEIISICDKYPIFDKINIDWEYISPAGKSYGLPTNITSPDDGANFILFLKSMREKLNSSGKSRYKISGALVAAPDKMDALPVEDLAIHLDEFHLMTYDYNSSAWGETKTGHHTNLRPADYCPYSVEESVDAYLKRGVPPGKIYIGAAFYSRGFANTDSLGDKSFGSVKDKSWEEGVLDYKDLPVDGAVELWDDKCKAHYSYDSTKNEINSYDTVRSIEEKCKYVKEKGLKGIIVWETCGDVPYDHPRSLTRALYENLMVSSAPVTSVPVTSAPVTSAPVTSAPVTSAPVTSAPVTSAPVTPPVTSTPVTSTPVTSTPVTSTPVTSAPVTPPVTSTPVTPPVTSTPVTSTPVTCCCNPVKSINIKNVEIELLYEDGSVKGFKI
jgi:chitinase